MDFASSVSSVSKATWSAVRAGAVDGIGAPCGVTSSGVAAESRFSCRVDRAAATPASVSTIGPAETFIRAASSAAFVLKGVSKASAISVSSWSPRSCRLSSGKFCSTSSSGRGTGVRFLDFQKRAVFFRQRGQKLCGRNRRSGLTTIAAGRSRTGFRFRAVSGDCHRSGRTIGRAQSRAESLRNGSGVAAEPEFASHPGVRPDALARSDFERIVRWPGSTLNGIRVGGNGAKGDGKEVGTGDPLEAGTLSAAGTPVPFGEILAAIGGRAGTCSRPDGNRRGRRQRWLRFGRGSRIGAVG